MAIPTTDAPTVALKGISQYYVQVPDHSCDGSDEDKLLPDTLRRKCAMASRVLAKVTFRQCMMFLNDRVRNCDRALSAFVLRMMGEVTWHQCSGRACMDHCTCFDCSDLQ